MLKLQTKCAEVHQVDDAPAGSSEEDFDWGSVAPEPGEGHGLEEGSLRADSVERSHELTGEAAIEYARATLPLPRARPRRLWPTLGAIIAASAGLAKVAVFLAIAHIDVGATHAGIATVLFVFGVVLLFCGFTMRWTSWDFGLAQVLYPDLYDELGLWLLRIGVVMACFGAIAVIALEYLP